MNHRQKTSIEKRAVNKKDGVYKYQGIYYAVKNNKLIAWIYVSGIAFCDLGGVNACIGHSISESNKRKELLSFLKRESISSGS